jgi:phosphopantothenoylcysteine decarboxylase / phosphopantothenate---cysteine ligase
MARVLLGVSGGIAAYKAVEVVRLLTGAGHAVRVIQTPTSLRFVGRATFEAVTDAPVLVDEFEPDPARGAYPGEPRPEHDPISHLELVRRADAYCVVPASANTLAKLAGGLADNLLTSAALACCAPLLVAPAMNNAMWEHPATAANVETLRARGAIVVGPDSGRLASRGEAGVGRLADPGEIAAAIGAATALATAHVTSVGDKTVPRAASAGAAEPSSVPHAVTSPANGAADPANAAFSGRQSLAGVRVLVTAGGTREPIDSVRYVGNRSSGRMGLALAEEAAARGAEVVAICANVSLPHPEGVRVIGVETAAELETAARAEFPDADVLLMAAAVADFRPATPADDKITKTGRDGLAIDLEPTTDVLAALSSQRRPEQTLVGFAAEHGEGAVERGRGKLERKGLDAVVVNDISRADIGFDTDDNEVVIVTAAGEQTVGMRSKAAVAAAVLDAVESLRTSAGAVGTVEDST